MALDPRLANQTALDMCDAGVDACDAGSNAALLRIYTGSAPTNVDAAASGTLLGTLVLSDPAFGAAADQNPSAQAAASAVTSDTSADATGVAGYYRVWTSNDGSTPLNAVMQGSAGEAADTTNMTLDDKNIVIGGTIAVSAFTFDVNES